MTEKPIPGTYLFDGRMARKGYALNKMCYSFNEARNREAFKSDEAAYCERFGLSDEQEAAVRNRNVLALLAAGGNVYYLAKFAGTFWPECAGYRRTADGRERHRFQGATEVLRILQRSRQRLGSDPRLNFWVALAPRTFPPSAGRSTGTCHRATRTLDRHSRRRCAATGGVEFKMLD